MNYRITIIDQFTRKPKEVIDYYETLDQANAELEEINQGMQSMAINNTIVSNCINLTGLKSFATSANGEHLIYQVEKHDTIIVEIFEIFKPYNQN